MDQSPEQYSRYGSSGQNNIVIVPTISFINKHEPPYAIAQQTSKSLLHSEVNKPSIQRYDIVNLAQQVLPKPVFTMEQDKPLYVFQQPIPNQINPATLVEPVNLTDAAIPPKPIPKPIYLPAQMSRTHSMDELNHTPVNPRFSELNDVNQNIANVLDLKTKKVNTWASNYLQSIGHDKIKPIKITLPSAKNKLKPNHTTSLQGQAIKYLLPTPLINTSNQYFNVGDKPLEYSESTFIPNQHIRNNIETHPTYENITIKTNQPMVVDKTKRHVLSLNKKKVSTQIESDLKVDSIYLNNDKYKAQVCTTLVGKGNNEATYCYYESKRQIDIFDANKLKLNYEVPIEQNQPIMKLPTHKDMCEKFIKEIRMKPPTSIIKHPDPSKSSPPAARELVTRKKNYRSPSERKTDTEKLIKKKNILNAESTTSTSKMEVESRLEHNHFKSPSPSKNELFSRKKNYKSPTERKTDIVQLIKKKKVLNTESQTSTSKMELETRSEHNNHSKSPSNAKKELFSRKKNYKSSSERKTDIRQLIKKKKVLKSESLTSTSKMELETRPEHNHSKSPSPATKDLFSRKKNYKTPSERKIDIEKIIKKKKVLNTESPTSTSKMELETRPEHNHSKSPSPATKDLFSRKKNYKTPSERKIDIKKLIKKKNVLNTESPTSTSKMELETRPQHNYSKSPSPAKKEVTSPINKYKLPTKRKTELNKFIKKKKVLNNESWSLKSKTELEKLIKIKDILNKESSKIDKKITTVQQRVKKSKSPINVDTAMTREYCRNQQKPVINFKEFDHLSIQSLVAETKQKIVKNNSPERQKLKRVRTFSEEIRNSSIKSVVKAENQNDNKRQRIDECFDLRSKLSRVNQRINNNLETPIQNDTLSIKLKSPKQTGLKCETKKCKKLKLIINVVCQESDCETSSDSSHSETENKSMHIMDYSFLDDIDVDEIVDSLKQHSPKHTIKKPVSPYEIKTEDGTITPKIKLSDIQITKNPLLPLPNETKATKTDIKPKINLSDTLNNLINAPMEENDEEKPNWSQNSKLTTHALIKILSESNSLSNEQKTDESLLESSSKESNETNVNVNTNIENEPSFEDPDLSHVNESMIITNQDSSIIDLTNVDDQESPSFFKVLIQETSCDENTIVRTKQALQSVLIDDQGNNFVHPTNDTAGFVLNNISSGNHIFKNDLNTTPPEKETATQPIPVEVESSITLNSNVSLIDLTNEEEYEQIKMKKEIETQAINVDIRSSITLTSKECLIDLTNEEECEQIKIETATQLIDVEIGASTILNSKESLINLRNERECEQIKMKKETTQPINVEVESSKTLNNKESLIELENEGEGDPINLRKETATQPINVAVESSKTLNNKESLIDLKNEREGDPINLRKETATQPINVAVESSKTLNNKESLIDLKNEREGDPINLRKETATQPLNVAVESSKTLNNKESLIKLENEGEGDPINLRKETATQPINVAVESSKTLNNKENLIDLKNEREGDPITLRKETATQPINVKVGSSKTLNGEESLLKDLKKKRECERINMKTLLLKKSMKKYLHRDIEIINYITHGKFSDIFKCKDSSGQNYGVKLMHSSNRTLGIEKENMIKHIQYDIPQQNLNILFIIDGFVTESYCWCYITEYYPWNLQQALNNQNKPFHIDRVQILARQLVSAVMVLRTKDIVHSDIRPSHILLDANHERLKLCGFDEAYYIKDEKPIPNIGSYYYRAPEVILGLSASFNIDIWSSAIVIHQMATHKILFRGKYNNEILFQQLSCLGNLPLDMVELSPYRSQYFLGRYFRKRVGPKPQDSILISSTFHKTRLIHYSINDAFRNNWKSKRPCKLNALISLLDRMIVLDPRNRLSIESVCADPFIHEM